MRDFTVYFLTLTLGVSIFYIFNSIESQQAIMDITTNQSNSLHMLGQIMSSFSILVAVILGFLIIYANRYLLKRRKKEFGIYLTLGMERRRISRILVFETIFVGALALVAGSVLGILLSQGMAVITTRLLGAGITTFQFIFSWEALQKAILYFGLTFLLVMIFNVIMIRRQKLIDLIYADRHNERFKAPRLAISVIIFIAALVCLAVAYYLILDRGIFMIPTLWSAIAFGVIGTFLFFFSLSGFLLELMQRMKRVYFKNLNMFVLRQINSKINTTYISITLVCLMLFASISTLSSGVGLARAVNADIARGTPFDATLSLNPEYDFDDSTYGPYPPEGIDIAALARDRVDLDRFTRDYQAIRYYGGDPSDPSLKTVVGTSVEFEVSYLKLSDYNRISAMQGLSPLILNHGEYALASTTGNEEWLSQVKDMAAGHSLTVDGMQVSLNPSHVFNHALEVSSNTNSNLVMVVPDALLESAPVKRDVLILQYRDPAAESVIMDSLASIGILGVDPILQTKTEVINQNSTIITTVTYLAVYLGMIFLVASATVLAIAQLSESSDNARRYKLLHKLGTETPLINRAIFTQILIYFGVPLALAIVHSIVGINVAADAIGSLGATDILASSIVAALVIIAIYGGYFLITYFGSRSVVHREFLHHESDT
jgi:putative ABC transport system permease protein